MTFTVTGEADLGRETQQFETEIEADSESHARELVKSRFGSKHGISRANVRVTDIQS